MPGDEDRYQSAKEVLVGLRRCAAPSIAHAAVISTRPRKIPSWVIALLRFAAQCRPRISVATE